MGFRDQLTVLNKFRLLAAAAKRKAIHDLDRTPDARSKHGNALQCALHKASHATFDSALARFQAYSIEAAAKVLWKLGVSALARFQAYISEAAAKVLWKLGVSIVRRLGIITTGCIAFAVIRNNTHKHIERACDLRSRRQSK